MKLDKPCSVHDLLEFLRGQLEDGNIELGDDIRIDFGDGSPCTAGVGWLDIESAKNKEWTVVVLTCRP